MFVVVASSVVASCKLKGHCYPPRDKTESRVHTECELSDPEEVKCGERANEPRPCVQALSLHVL